MHSLSIKSYDDLQGFMAVSRLTVSSILRFRAIGKFRQGISNFFLSKLISIALPIIGFFLYWFLAYQVRKLRTYVLKDFILNLDNYKTYRQHFDKLSGLLEKLKPFTELKIEAIDWYARPFVKLAIEAIQIVNTYYCELSAKIAILDAPPTNLPKGWHVVSGQELWRGRPLGYEYLV